MTIVTQFRPDAAWYAALLDGSLHEVDIRPLSGFMNMAALRAAIYRRAAARHLDIRTHQLDHFRLWVKAAGNRDDIPSLRELSPEDVVPLPVPKPAAPVADPLDQELAERCTCGTEGPIGHPPSCAVWR